MQSTTNNSITVNACRFEMGERVPMTAVNANWPDLSTLVAPFNKTSKASPRTNLPLRRGVEERAGVRRRQVQWDEVPTIVRISRPPARNTNSVPAAIASRRTYPSAMTALSVGDFTALVT